MAKAWSHDSAVDDCAWLKQFENEEIHRFISKKTCSQSTDFHVFRIEIGAQIDGVQVGMYCSINEKHSWESESFDDALVRAWRNAAEDVVDGVVAFRQ